MSWPSFCALVLCPPSCDPEWDARSRDRADGSSQGRAKDATRVSTAEAKSTVLVVEDDAVIRHAAVAMVTDAGFAVREATNGNEAIRILDDGLDAGEAVCVVVTDIDMPLGIDGIKLAACINRRWPGIGIVITSGKVRPAPGDVPNDGLFIRKPYTEEGLIAAIRSVMP